MGRTENPTDRLEASRGHRHWAKEIGPNQPLFRVDHGVRPKNNLTEPALLEMSGYRVYQASDWQALWEDYAFTLRGARHIGCALLHSKKTVRRTP